MRYLILTLSIVILLAATASVSIAADETPLCSVKAAYNGKEVAVTPELMRKGFPIVLKLAEPLTVELQGADAQLPKIDEKTDYVQYTFIDPVFVQYTKNGQGGAEKLEVDKILVVGLDGGMKVYVSSGKRVFLQEKVVDSKAFNEWRKQAGLAK